jgi:hypothetical protein
MEPALVCHAGEVAAEQPANPRNRPKATTSKDFICESPSFFILDLRLWIKVRLDITGKPFIRLL